jgi:ABC-type amino acid transport substrate-binding protein
VLAVIGAYFMNGRLRVNRSRLLVFAAGSVAIVGAFLLGSRLLLAAVLPGPESAAETFDRLKVTGDSGRLAKVAQAPDALPPAVAPIRGLRLETIQKRGSVRVCVSADAMPWAFVNGRGEIVGFEVDVAHTVALDLQTDLILVPVPRVARGSALTSGACDIAVGRMVPSEANAMAFSRPLAHEVWAFLTPDEKRHVFASLDRIRELPAPRIAVFREPAWIDRVKALVPNAEVIGVESIPEFVGAPAGRFDAMFTGFDRASAYSLMYPQFAPVLPEPGLGSVPIAIIVPTGEEALLDTMNAAVDVGTASGVFAEKLDYWVHGKGAALARRPRGSIGRDVLGWWRD